MPAAAAPAVDRWSAAAGSAPPTLVEAAAAAVRGELAKMPPRFPGRAAFVVLYSWALQHCSGWPGAALLLILFLLWLAWDAAKARDATEAATRTKLAAPLKVAEFAQQLGVSSGCAVGLADDFSASQACRRFADVRSRTHCLFAAKARLWGNDWAEEPYAEPGSAKSQLAANIARCLPRLYRFCLEVKAGAPLDGFVFEARGAHFGADVESFARTVRHLLGAVSEADPAGVDCMRKSYIGRRSWFFQFAKEPLFVTAFAPCYPSSHPRYQFGAHPDSCFVLFQPEMSFLRHDLPPDRARSATDWDKPADVRDRIRVNFRRHGREYRIPETTSYPPAEFIVPPLDALKADPVRFWLPACPAMAAADAAGGPL